jgi:hypothetical protein
MARAAGGFRCENAGADIRGLRREWNGGKTGFSGNGGGEEKQVCRPVEIVCENGAKQWIFAV